MTKLMNLGALFICAYWTSCHTLFLNINAVIYLFIFKIFSVVQVQLSPFPHHHSPHHNHPHFLLLILPTFGFVHVSFIHVPSWPFPYFAPLSLSPTPSGYCQFVLYFSVSGYILLANQQNK